jgi:hypothetical protein
MGYLRARTSYVGARAYPNVARFKEDKTSIFVPPLSGLLFFIFFTRTVVYTFECGVKARLG